MNLDQIISIAGAFLILFAYGLLQLEKTQRDSNLYLGLNFVGGLCLLYGAVISRQLGFIILEASWTLISLRGFFIKKTG